MATLSRQRPRQRSRRLAKLLLAGLTLSFCLLLGEGVLRLVGGYRLFGLRLVQARTQSSAEESAHALDLAVDVVEPFVAEWRARRPDLDLNWLRTSPPPLPPKPPLGKPAVKQSERLLHYYVLNEVALRSPAARALLNDPQVSLPDEFTVFEPPGGLPVPHYRYPASRTLPTGLVTNAFGFRGRDIAVDKPARTVRLAFVGASTTVEAHGLPHSAPELIEHWLELWGAREGLNVHFEVLNAAREAIKSPDINAIVAYEVLPLAIDYLVYYEGANQFQPATLQRHVAVDGDYALASPPPGVVGTFDDTATADATWLDALATHLALARYLRSAMAGSERLAEPSKPAQHITLAPELMADPFPLERAGEVLQCGAIAADLDAIRRLVEANGGHMVLSTFWWLAQDGMLLDPVWAKNVHIHLNRAYWPFSYATIRKLADVQNRFFAAWAAAHDVDLLDVGRLLPQHEQLAIDAIHQNEVGVRLKAWVMFAGLTKVIARDLAAGEVPVPDDRHDGVHPYIGPVKVLTRADIGLPK